MIQTAHELDHGIVNGAEIEPLIELLAGNRVVVLAGAGCSTESGIPDYRGPDSDKHRRPPIQYQDFMRAEAARARYWARSAVGWPRMANAMPNPAHVALAQMEHSGAVAGIITQNVDGLHHAAGSTRVVELHGSLATVCCTQCSACVRRGDYQRELLERNSEWVGSLSNIYTVAPDGDAELPQHVVENFNVPACETCGGIMKPDVVFFGENVPRTRVEEAWRLFDEGDVLLVTGSSLTVYSGRRFVYAAAEKQIPVAVVNLGPTRVDELAAVKLDARLGDVMPLLAEALAPRA